VDITGVSIKLENLANSMDKLPLVSNRTTKSTSTPERDANLNQWQRLTHEIWQDVKSMIELERIDRPEPPLIAPEQNFFLRENIKLRLLTARIALLQHDQATYRRDLQDAQQWLKSHFDTRDATTKMALSAIHQLLADNIVIQIPDVSESLRLVSQYKLLLARS
jgi:uroporphyrin-3 C-methyltransferase